MTQGGSGYTAPKVNVTRGYNIIKKHRQFDTKYQKINRLAPAALATFASSTVVLDELKHEKIEQTEVLSSPYIHSVRFYLQSLYIEMHLL